jgi:hypothetical protein
MKIANLEFLDPKMAAIASVEVPRAAKLAEETAAAAPAAGATAAAPAAGAAAAAPAADAKKAEAPKKDEKKK